MAFSMTTIRFLLSLFVMALGCATGTVAQEQRRAALVIGNAAYVHARGLPNPRNDAMAMATLFRKHSFDVVEAFDLGYKPMRDAIRKFSITAASADTVVVYFAGHGMELGGENYLLPVDAKLTTSDDLEYEAVKLSSLLGALGKARRLSLIMLDACRDNPLAAKMTVLSTTRSVDRGLGRVEAKGDILIAYAAQAGHLAEDGATQHSPFTQALLENLADPRQDIRMAFGGVRDAVRRTTNGKQEPYVSQSLGGGTIGLLETTETKFPTVVAPAVKALVPAQKPEASGDVAARSAWEGVKQSCSVEDLQQVAVQHAGTPFAELAKQRMRLIETKAECAAWAPAKQAPVVPPAAAEKAAPAATKSAAPAAKDAGDVDWRNPKVPASAGTSCEATRVACANIRLTCLRACRQEMATRNFGNCNSCVTDYPICVSQGSRGACQ
jgi:hypothetical protein